MWLVLGWLLVAAVVIASLVPARSLPEVNVSDKFEHAMAYVVMTLWFAGIYRRSRYAHIAAGFFLLGAAIEFAQGAMNLGRQRDYHDVIANAVGISIGLLLAWLALGRWAHRLEQLIHQ
jgi:VanZ family protein